MKDKNNGKERKTSYIFTRETFGMTTLLFCAVVLIMLLTRNLVFADIGSAICTFMYGTFGYGSYLVLAALSYLGIWLAFEKKVKISFLRALWISLTLLCVFMLAHAATTATYVMDGYGKYISDCYVNAAKGWSGYTGGGVISAILVYPVAKYLTFIGAYIIFSVLTVLFGYLTFLSFKGRKGAANKATVNVQTENVTAQQQQSVAQPVVEEHVSEAPAQYAPTHAPAYSEEPAANANDLSQKNLGRKILFENGEFAAESYRRNMIFNESSYFNRPQAPLASEEDYLRSFTEGGAKTDVPKNGYTESYQQEVYDSPANSAPVNYVYDEKPATEFGNYEDNYNNNSYNEPYSPPYEQPAVPPVYEQKPEPYQPVSYGNAEDDYPEYTEGEEYKPNVYGQAPEAPYRSERIEEAPAEPVNEIRNVGFGDREEPRKTEDIPAVTDEQPFMRRENRAEQRRNSELFDSDELDDEDVFGRPLRRGAPEDLNAGEPVRRTAEDRAPRGIPEQPGITEERRTVPLRPVEPPKPAAPAQPAQSDEPPKPEEKPKHIWKKYVRPSLDLLDDYPENSNVNTGEIEDNKRIIVESLGRYRIASEVSNVTIGPAITRYDVIIQDKTKVKEALKYRDAIAMELRKDNVTAYLNYTKGALSIEVPNNRRTIVGLKSMLASSNFLNSKPYSLTFGLGKNVDGDVVCPDITKMPHLLVAGTTGSGKSICLSALLISLLYKYGPEELRLILVDPKQVEFVSYDKLPHLMINEILYECNKAIKALNWAINEMEHRYALFKEMTEAGRATKTLDEYNAHLPEGEEKLPKILIVLDEFGDLMLQAKKDIETRIIKLVQKARAAGIHLILATQRPSVDCITGLIKSNLPTRIGFKVNSFDDAKTIFDFGGAEKLLGKGDLYYRSPDGADLARIQGCFVDTHEVQKVTDFVKANNETYFDQSVSDFINTVEQEETPASLSSSGDGEEVNTDTKIDDTFIKALKYCVTSNQASVSMIQRRFPVGYIKACKIIDWMEKMNYVTQSEGSKPRKVLLSKDEFLMTFGDVDD
ncbi:MAG: DNA translocase FtsK [Clostridia bacterium]|nr:DNA translocase FtsK [Clostridia bacterium]